jgi:DMSO/TMAO reductase YedYZ molybdopterin-dependent catalytic subunit
VPAIDASSYRLAVDGAVSNPLSLSYRELRDRASSPGS